MKLVNVLQQWWNLIMLVTTLLMGQSEIYSFGYFNKTVAVSKNNKTVSLEPKQTFQNSLLVLYWPQYDLVLSFEQQRNSNKLNEL